MAAEVGYDVRPPVRTRPLRLAPAPTRPPAHTRAPASPSRREVAYALTLGLVLGLGVLAVLVLNTLMQQQSRTIAAEHAALDALALRQQTLQLQLDAMDNPRALAERARALHMRPAGMLTPLRPAAKRAVSARGPGTRPTRAG
jgi:uncharacterized protein HemX